MLKQLSEQDGTSEFIEKAYGIFTGKIVEVKKNTKSTSETKEFNKNNLNKTKKNKKAYRTSNKKLSISWKRFYLFYLYCYGNFGLQKLHQLNMQPNHDMNEEFINKAWKGFQEQEKIEDKTNIDKTSPNIHQPNSTISNNNSIQNTTSYPIQYQKTDGIKHFSQNQLLNSKGDNSFLPTNQGKNYTEVRNLQNSTYQPLNNSNIKMSNPTNKTKDYRFGNIFGLDNGVLLFTREITNAHLYWGNRNTNFSHMSDKEFKEWWDKTQQPKGISIKIISKPDFYNYPMSLYAHDPMGGASNNYTKADASYPVEVTVNGEKAYSADLYVNATSPDLSVGQVINIGNTSYVPPIPYVSPMQPLNPIFLEEKYGGKVYYFLNQLGNIGFNKSAILNQMDYDIHEPFKSILKKIGKNETLTSTEVEQLTNTLIKPSRQLEPLIRDNKTGIIKIALINHSDINKFLPSYAQTMINDTDQYTIQNDTIIGNIDEESYKEMSQTLQELSKVYKIEIVPPEEADNYLIVKQFTQTGYQKVIGSADGRTTKFFDDKGAEKTFITSRFYIPTEQQYLNTNTHEIICHGLMRLYHPHDSFPTLPVEELDNRINTRLSYVVTGCLNQYKPQTPNVQELSGVFQNLLNSMGPMDIFTAETRMGLRDNATSFREEFKANMFYNFSDEENDCIKEFKSDAQDRQILQYEKQIHTAFMNAYLKKNFLEEVKKNYTLPDTDMIRLEDSLSDVINNAGYEYFNGLEEFDYNLVKYIDSLVANNTLSDGNKTKEVINQLSTQMVNILEQDKHLNFYPKNANGGYNSTNSTGANANGGQEKTTNQNNTGSNNTRDILIGCGVSFASLCCAIVALYYCKKKKKCFFREKIEKQKVPHIGTEENQIEMQQI